MAGSAFTDESGSTVPDIMSGMGGASSPPVGGRVLYWAVLGIVAVAPLPFGSNQPWSWSLLATLAGALLVIWSIAHLRSSRPLPVAAWRVALPAGLFISVCLYAAAQTLPILPPSLAHPLWSLDPALQPATGLFTISLSPADTLTALLRLLSYGIIFWLVLQGSRQARRADDAIGTIAVASGLYSAYGVIAVLAGSDSILWFEKWAYEGVATSTFVNRNSFATYAGLGLLCAAAYLFRALVSAEFDQRSVRRFIGDLLGGMTPLMMGAFVTIPLNIAALFLTQSRAGITFSLLALVIFVVGLSMRLKARRSLAVSFAALTLAATTYYFMISGAGFVARLDLLIGSDLASNARVVIYNGTVAKILETPWLGVGYGTFEDVYRTIRSPEMGGRFFRAHNTYLENALELGIPAASALALSIALLARRALMGLRRRRSVFVYGWMAFCATVLVGGHALVDFSLQMPAIAATFAAILGVGCSQSWSSRTDTSG